MTDVSEFGSHTVIKMKNGGEPELKKMDSISDMTPSMTEADLVSSYEDAKATFALVVRNRVSDALKLCGSKSSSSMFHSLSQTAIALSQAYLTLDPVSIDFAMDSSSMCARQCYQRRRKSSITDNTFTKANKRKFYDEFTEMEIHAELCYAQCQALRAFATLVRDEKVITFLKAGFRFRLSYQAYKLCQEILAHRTTWNNEYLKREFDCGLAFGIGTYNVVLSSFPKRFQKVFEFIGFSAKFDVGEGQLEEANQFSGCLMQLISSLVILGFHLVFCTAGTRTCGSLDYAESVLNACIKDHPDSPIFSAFAGRAATVRGNNAQAIQLYQVTLKEDFELMSNIRHIVYWEMAWCRIIGNDFRAAVSNLETLCHESNWSKVIILYTTACVLYSCEDVTEEDRNKVATMFREATKARKMFAGKNVPMEKELCRKCELFFLQGNYMMLPLYEIMYIYNYFNFLPASMLEIIIKRVEIAMDNLKTRKDCKFTTDNLSLGIFIKGVCLNLLGKKAAAEECFKDVLKNQKKIKEATHLLDSANMELGYMYMDLKKPTIAKSYFKDALKQDTIWVEFRVLRAREELKTGKKR